MVSLFLFDLFSLDDVPEEEERLLNGKGRGTFFLDIVYFVPKRNILKVSLLSFYVIYVPAILFSS